MSLRRQPSSTYATENSGGVLFQDFKRRGWDIEGTVIADRARLERLLLVLFLGVWWVSHLAAACIHQGPAQPF